MSKFSLLVDPKISFSMKMKLLARLSWLTRKADNSNFLGVPSRPSCFQCTKRFPHNAGGSGQSDRPQFVLRNDRMGTNKQLNSNELAQKTNLTPLLGPAFLVGR